MGISGNLKTMVLAELLQWLSQGQKTGTLVIFDGRTPHRSGANRSADSRMAYTLHVIDKNCHYRADNWLQRRPDLPLRGFAA